MDQTSDSWSARAFRSLDTEAKGYLLKDEILSIIDYQGVYHHHSLHELIKTLEAKKPDEQIAYDEFNHITHGLFFLKRVLEWDLTIPHFDKFRQSL